MMDMKKESLHMITFPLMAVGGLNWLVFALFHWEIGEVLFGGSGTTISTIVYTLVGVSTLYELFMHKNFCKVCEAMMAKKKMMGGGSSMAGKM